jgi:KDO2-lipid IV(A) lauroyltransferase
MTLLSKLAQKNNSTVIFTYAKRLQDGSGFKIIFRAASEDISQLSLEESVAVINSNIEQLIRETPYQYQWTYKRFKEQPEGHASAY